MTTTIYKLQFLGDMNISASTVYLIWFCLIFVLSIHMSKELFQMATYGKRNYFSSIDNWFQLTALSITLTSLVPYLPHKLQISIGSFSILFAWICMSLFFQDLELLSLGKYIVAFRYLGNLANFFSSKRVPLYLFPLPFYASVHLSFLNFIHVP